MALLLHRLNNVPHDQPRAWLPDDARALAEDLFPPAAYRQPATEGEPGRHAWRRVIPEKITSWDVRKIRQ